MPVCYSTKRDAVKAFAVANRDVIDAWGGLFKTGSGGEFDAINERYGLKGKRRVTTIDKAIGAALPTRRPFCLDKLDLETLNETGPAREAPFRLPYDVEEAIAAKRYADYYALSGPRKKKSKWGLLLLALAIAIPFVPPL